MAGYVRQSSFVDGDTVTAALFNNEYNQLVNAFHNSTGHAHDGTAASGPVIGLIGDAGETSPNNKVLIDTTNNFIEFYVQVSNSPVQQLYIADGAIIPVTDSDVDLGTTSLRFKDTYTDTITTTGNVAVGGNLTVTGTTTFNGGTITMGDAATDNVVFGADVNSNIIPNTDSAFDLGSSTQEWRDLYLDGTAHIDTLDVDVNATIAGTLGVTGVLTGTSLDISGDIDVDGTTNLDVVDIDGAVDMATTLTVGGEITAASLDISGNVDIDGTLEADAITVNGIALAETISDTVGAMVASNTETNITVSYDDADNTLDFVVGTLNQDTTGNAATATALQTARTIHGVSFDGTANIDLTEVVQDTVGAMFTSNTESGITVAYQDVDGTVDFTVGTLNQDTTGNAATATALATARTIGGTSFDGTANIAVGLAATATALATARTIGGVSFDGTANIVPTTFNAATFSGDLNVDSGVLFADVSTNRVGINQTTPDVSLDLGANTDAVHVPVGTTAQRPTSPAAGYFRYNTTTGGFEGYTDAWGAIAGGGGGGTAPSLDTMTGDGSDTTLTLSTAPINENATFVTIDGVAQHKDTYSISGNTLTFSEAPPNTSKVECITLVATSSTTANILSDADADTKIQVEESSDEDKIRFDTGGTERMIIDTSGNVGIGTTSPSSKLDVAGNIGSTGTISSTSVLNCNGSGSSDSQVNIGVGRNANGYAFLDLVGDTTYPDYGLRIIRNNSGANTTSVIQHRGTGNLGFVTQEAAAIAFATSNTERFKIDPLGIIGIGTNTFTNSYKTYIEGLDQDTANLTDSGNHGATLYLRATANTAGSGGAVAFGTTFGNKTPFAAIKGHVLDGSTNTLGDLCFSTRASVSATALTERLRIKNDGSVGIGTASPSSELHVSSSAPIITATATNNNSGLRLNVVGGGIELLRIQDNGTNRMVIDASGNVGIGTTSPTEKLDVNGNIKIGTTANSNFLNRSDSHWVQYNGGATTNNTYIRVASIGAAGISKTISMYTDAVERMRIDSSGNLLVGKTTTADTTTGTRITSTGSMMQSNSGTGNHDMHDFYRGTEGSLQRVGNIRTNGSSTAYNTSSDARLKDVTGEARGLEVINELNPVSYNWKATGEADEGLIAQEVLDIVPNAVSGSEEEMYQMDYSKLVVHLVAGMKEQQTQIEALQSEINLLKGE